MSTKPATCAAVLEVPRSSFYYAGQDPADGALLRREGQVSNRKHVQRLMREMGLQARRRPRKVHTPIAGMIFYATPTW